MKYAVLVTADATVHAVIEVEADSAEAANDIALDIATSDATIAWELDDGNASDPYLADPETAATPLDHKKAATAYLEHVETKPSTDIIA